MKRLCEIILLEVRALMRSGTPWMLALASCGWVFAVPRFITGDGTPEGARELYVRYGLGGVFVLLAVALVASATGAIAHERAARRLQLTLVRPVSGWTIAVGKMIAHTLLGAIVLALAAVMLVVRCDTSRVCNHVLSPVLPSVQEEARTMYDAYMKDPETPPEVKRASKSVIMRLLENKALDHYQVIPTNAAVQWRFAADALRTTKALTVRMRVTNNLDVRQDVVGTFRLGAAWGVVSNITQAVVTTPLIGTCAEKNELSFFNAGKNALMLRPRRDIQLLVAADGWLWNLTRAYGELVAILALLVAWGVFLSASLSRPVALFTAVVMLLLAEMSPAVIEQYPDALETSPTDRIGLFLTRLSASVTHPVSALAPLEHLAKDECIERAEVLQALAVDMLLLPLLLALLTAVVMPRKSDVV